VCDLLTPAAGLVLSAIRQECAAPSGHLGCAQSLWGAVCGCVSLFVYFNDYT